MTQIMAQSPTSLQTFLTCPKQYHAKYVTKEVKFADTPHTIFGTQVHACIENYLKDGEPLPTLLTPMQPFLDNAKNVFIGAETKLAVDKQGRVVDFFDKTAYQRCIVDAVIGDPNGTIICIDWKTGKKRDAQTQHDFIKKCAKAKYPNANIVTYFIYLFIGESDRQEYHGEPLSRLDRDMERLYTAHANGTFTPAPSGLCKKWCDVLSCKFNGKNK